MKTRCILHSRGDSAVKVLEGSREITHGDLRLQKDSQVDRRMGGWSYECLWRISV